MGSKRKFTGFWRVSAVSRQAAVGDWKFETLVPNGCFHRHQTFAALCIYDRLADIAPIRQKCTQGSFAPLWRPSLRIAHELDNAGSNSLDSAWCTNDRDGGQKRTWEGLRFG
ncbi:hypothetical protein SuNHUV7_05450 (plasmid) [Pseudoseohaeicola sp. NH-UV-7]